MNTNANETMISGDFPQSALGEYLRSNEDHLTVLTGEIIIGLFLTIVVGRSRGILEHTLIL